MAGGSRGGEPNDRSGRVRKAARAAGPLRGTRPPSTRYLYLLLDLDLRQFVLLDGELRLTGREVRLREHKRHDLRRLLRAQ